MHVTRMTAAISRDVRDRIEKKYTVQTREHLPKIAREDKARAIRLSCEGWLSAKRNLRFAASSSPQVPRFARAFLECSFLRYLKFLSDERLDAVLASQSQAQKTAGTFQVDVKIKKGSHLPSAAADLASSARETVDGSNRNSYPFSVSTISLRAAISLSVSSLCSARSGGFNALMLQWNLLRVAIVRFSGLSWDMAAPAGAWAETAARITKPGTTAALHIAVNT
jgi:hypothetical protein